MGCDDWKDWDRMDREAEIERRHRESLPKISVPLERSYSKGNLLLETPVKRVMSHALELHAPSEDTASQLDSLYTHISESSIKDRKKLVELLARYRSDYATKYLQPSRRRSYEFDHPGYLDATSEMRTDQYDEVDRSAIRRHLHATALSGILLSRPYRLSIVPADAIQEYVDTFDKIISNPQEISHIFIDMIIKDELINEQIPGYKQLIKSTINPLTDLQRSPKNEHYGEFAI